MERVLAGLTVLALVTAGCVGNTDPGIVEYGGDEVYLEEGELKSYSGLLETHRREIRNKTYTLEIRDQWTVFVESNATILRGNVTEVVKRKGDTGVLVRNESRSFSEGRREGRSNVFGTEHGRVTTYWLPDGDDTTYVRVNSTYPGEQNSVGGSGEPPGVRYPLEGRVEGISLTGTGSVSYRGYNASVLEVVVTTEDSRYTGSIYIDVDGVIHKIRLVEEGTGEWDHEVRMTLKTVGGTSVMRPDWVADQAGVG